MLGRNLRSTATLALPAALALAGAPAAAQTAATTDGDAGARRARARLRHAARLRSPLRTARRRAGATADERRVCLGADGRLGLDSRAVAQRHADLG
jgi:hypothetical protein